MDSGTANLLEMLSERVMELANAGKWSEAMLAADAAVDKARTSFGGEFKDVVCLASTLEIKGDLLRQQDKFDDARVCYLEVLEMLNGRVECTEILARVSASIGVLYDFGENDEEAILFYERAIVMYERLDPPRLEEVADICNNLGFIYRSLDNMDAAILFNNVGALYLKSGHEDQAREMHTMALEGRQAVLGENHPDTAQSYSNLALTLAQIGELEQAIDYFQKSLAIYENHIKKEAYEYAAVAENYAEVLRASGDEKGAANVIKKSQKKLSKVQG